MRIATILGSAVLLALMGCNGDDTGGTTMAECPQDAGTGSIDDGGGMSDPDAQMLDGGGFVVRTAFLTGAPTRVTGLPAAMEGGSDFQLNCDVGKVVAGFEALSTSERIWGFRLRCSELRVVKFDEGSFEVRGAGASAGMLVGTMGAGASEERGDCGPNTFARGIYGKYDDTQIFALGLLCGQGEVNGSEEIEVVGASNSAFFGGGAGMMFDVACPDNQILTGISGRADADPVSGGILAVAGICAPAIVLD